MNMKCKICGKELDGVYSHYNFHNWECSNCYAGDSPLHSERGCRVKVKSVTNGWDSDIEKAQKYFNVGDVYTVENVEIGGCISYLTLKEFPNIKFNTVNFALCKTK